MGLEIVSLFVVALLLFFICNGIHERRGRRRQLPPGPRPWPLAGNLLSLVGFSPLRSLAHLSSIYGPIMTIQLGAMTTVVVSTPDAARDMFKAHDAALGGRMVYECMKLRSGSAGSIITAQIGPHWRMLRRLCASQFFTTARIDATEGVRRRCVDSLVRAVKHAGRGGACPVDIGRLFFLGAFDHIGRVVLSRELLGSDVAKEGCEFFRHAKEIMRLAGRANAADFVPWLRRWDPQGIRRGMDFHVGKALEIVTGFVEERKRGREDDGDHISGRRRRNKDLLDVLLEFEGDGVEEPHKLTAQTINNLIFELFMGGTDTTASTLEWAMAELLRHPTTMANLRSELLRRTKTPNPEPLTEKDIAALPYLNAVIKETLRLHPPLPLLVPRAATKSCTVLGHRIPHSTQILVNVHKMGRDGKFWTNPEQFRPERFLEEARGVDFRGQHYELLPFGSGRRMCPALPLMSRMLPLVLATLLRSFDWALPGGLAPEEMHMGEQMGITLRKAVPLSVVAVPRTSCKKYEA